MQCLVKLTGDVMDRSGLQIALYLSQAMQIIRIEDTVGNGNLIRTIAISKEQKAGPAFGGSTKMYSVEGMFSCHVR
ncbi:hypothetical protein HOLleu_07379 [Holothuria leucospilota]|uniref:Uncharacterized protein n=1 Tax=Holothuria leucospilota TaxID=206669 RepID=A0A9Q1HFL0_HOLLE|nr:hypothetical protein HOLleu_07379 [Holothuria leucospilota]